MKNDLPLLAPQNVLDKAIAYFSPRLAVQRMQSRSMLALSGGYTGASIDRAALSRYMPRAGSSTRDVSADLPSLRARSRDQMRNAPIAVGALNTATSHVIGTGLSYTPAIDGAFLGLTDDEVKIWQDDVKRRYDAWAMSQDCDLSRTLNLYGLQELAFRSMMESGDTFVATPRIARAGRAARLALQLLEADRVCNPDGKPNSAEIVDGVKLSATTGEALSYFVAKNHPGDYIGPNSWQEVPARGEKTGRRNMLHLFKPLRPEQRRGIPWIATVIEPLKMLGQFTQAELRAAVTSAIFSVFVKMDAKAFDDLFDEDAKGAIIEKGTSWSGEIEDGKAVQLLPGEEIQSPTPGRPSPQFDPFVSAILRQIGIALELPFEVLIMSFQSSYSAARASLLMAWKFFRNRRDLMITMFCQPVLELWLADEVAEGRISAPGFFVDDVYRAAWCAAIWTGDAPGSIDPDKEVSAATKRVALGISTKDAESIAFDGQPWAPKHKQRVAETNAEKADGIYIAPGAAPVAPAPAPEPVIDDTAPGSGQPAKV